MALKKVYGPCAIRGYTRIWVVGPMLWFVSSLRNVDCECFLYTDSSCRCYGPLFTIKLWCRIPQNDIGDYFAYVLGSVSNVVTKALAPRGTPCGALRFSLEAVLA